MTSGTAFSGDDPRRLLSGTRELTRQVRRTQRATWFPLLVLAAVTFAAIPFRYSPHRLGTCAATEICQGLHRLPPRAAGVLADRAGAGLRGDRRLLHPPVPGPRRRDPRAAVRRRRDHPRSGDDRLAGVDAVSPAGLHAWLALACSRAAQLLLRYRPGAGGAGVGRTQRGTAGPGARLLGGRAGGRHRRLGQRPRGAGLPGAARDPRQRAAARRHRLSAWPSGPRRRAA